MSPEQEIEAGIAALEAQRAVLGDAVVDASLVGLRAKLSVMASSSPAFHDSTQTLRQVSILFLDVVGSTTLAQRLDPESIGAVLDDALKRGTAIVEQHRGRVLQYAGDNILAAFGTDKAREDDTERAVRCGLMLLQLGQTIGAEVLAAHDHAGFNVRVGIHTGSVLLGGGVDHEGSIRGQAVNIAARMEQTAPSGSLRISHDTYAQVRGMFEVQVQEALVVKGVTEPVQSCLVTRAKPRSFRIVNRGIEGVITRMIGREADLEALQSAFKRLFAERRFASVTVVADAGLGKSRLLTEFESWSDTRPENFFLFRGRATPQTDSQGFGLLRDILAWRFQVYDDDSIEVARKKMEDSIVPLFIDDDGRDLAEAHAHLLGHLIGIEWNDSRHVSGILDDPKQIRSRAFHSAAEIFRRVSASDGSPVVLQLEDLHWADDETLDFLDYLAEVDSDVPILVLAFTRPSLFERRAKHRSSEGFHQRIDLTPLDRNMSVLLANELLKNLPYIPAELREVLTNSAEGNPFYMEELVNMLIDQGVITAVEKWSVSTSRLRVTKVPPTLTGVLQARLDGLPSPEKRALQQASVIGAVFWDQALAAVETGAAEFLPALVQREMTLPRPDAPVEGLREYAFRHQLLHQVTFDTVLKRHKREWHARVAQWLTRLEIQGSLRAGDFLGLAAEHFEQAGDEANAAEFHSRAAERAGQRFAHERVLTHVRSALRLLGEFRPTQIELRWRLLSVRELTLDLQAKRQEQAADLDALEQLAVMLDDDRRRAEAARRRSIRESRTANWAAMESAARHSIDCATRAGDDGLRLYAMRQLATARVMQGDIDDGCTMALQGLAEARMLRLRSVEARLLNTLGIVAEMQGDLAGALQLDRQNLEIDRETGNRVSEAITLTNLGVGWLNLGDLAQARLEFDAALQMLRANGDRNMEGAALSELSTVALWQGDETEALALARSALDIAVEAQARDMQVLAALRIGDAELATGHLLSARQAYTQARTGALEIDSSWQHDGSAGLAAVALAEGEDAAALEILKPVLNNAADGGTLDGTLFPRRIELICYRTLLRSCDSRADNWLILAYTTLAAQAKAIKDAGLRRGFLNNIPHHDEIVVAWASRDATGDRTEV